MLDHPTNSKKSLHNLSLSYITPYAIRGYYNKKNFIFPVFLLYTKDNKRYTYNVANEEKVERGAEGEAGARNT